MARRPVVQPPGAGGDEVVDAVMRADRAGYLLLHHERLLAEAQRRYGERLLEVDLECKIVHLRHALGGVVAGYRALEQGDSPGYALRPAERRSDEVVRRKLVAVLESEVVAQGERPRQLVVADLPAIEHVVVEGAHCVEPQRELVEVPGNLPGNACGGPHGIERLDRGREREHERAALLDAGFLRDHALCGRAGRLGRRGLRAHHRLGRGLSRGGGRRHSGRGRSGRLRHGRGRGGGGRSRGLRLLPLLRLGGEHASAPNSASAAKNGTSLKTFTDILLAVVLTKGTCGPPCGDPLVRRSYTSKRRACQVY